MLVFSGTFNYNFNMLLITPKLLIFFWVKQIKRKYTTHRQRPLIKMGCAWIGLYFGLGMALYNSKLLEFSTISCFRHHFQRNASLHHLKSCSSNFKQNGFGIVENKNLILSKMVTRVSHPSTLREISELSFEVLTTSNLLKVFSTRDPLRSQGFSSKPDAPTTDHF